VEFWEFWLKSNLLRFYYQQQKIYDLERCSEKYCFSIKKQFAEDISTLE